MHELTCPSCGAAAHYDLNNKLHICQICSTSFLMQQDTHQKEIYTEHFIVPNGMDAVSVKGSVLEWLKRIHHHPEVVEKEFVVHDIRGVSIPFWVTSLELHTRWQGLVKRHGKNALKSAPGSEYLSERGEFKRSYRWAVSGRMNLCETWGLTRLHKPRENVPVEWDGFPLDSTMTRGRLETETRRTDGEPLNIYDKREFFDFKYSNNLPILSVQISSEEALRRARLHTELYHIALARLCVDYLVDIRTEQDIAGVQLIHLPFWQARYQLRPQGALKHFYRPTSKNILLEGSSRAVLKSELALVHQDKAMINSLVCGAGAVLFLILGLTLHPALNLVAVFCLFVAAASYFFQGSNRFVDADSQVKHGGLGYGANQE